MWENKIIIKYETKVSEASISPRQNIVRDFNGLYCCPIREQRLFKHHDSHRQVIKKCFTDSTIEFRDWNSSPKFHKECLLTSWNIFSNCVRLRQLIYQWVLGKILWDFQHSTSTIHHISPPDWQIHWEDKQCHWINVESFQQLESDKLNFSTADDTTSNKESYCFCNRNLIIFFTSQLWAEHYSDRAESDQKKSQWKILKILSRYSHEQNERYHEICPDCHDQHAAGTGTLNKLSLLEVISTMCWWQSLVGNKETIQHQEI